MTDSNPAPGETWRRVSIPGVSRPYEVSDQGRVRNQSKIFKLQLKDERRYRCYRTRLIVNGRQRYYAVHRLVLMTFVGPCPVGMECCHRDGNSLNNRLENLYWGTHSENELDRVRHGTHPQANKTHCPKGHEYSPENTYARLVGGRTCRACQRDYHRERHTSNYVRKGPPDRRPPRERFLGFVDQTEHCWQWTGTVSTGGYGNFWLDGGMRSAHRVAYEFFIGPIPAGVYVTQTCNVHSCVNPDHLQLSARAVA